jgi:sortase A
MGKRSDRRKFRRRRRWAGFLLLVSLALVVFGAQLFRGLSSPELQTTASRTAAKVGVERVKSPGVAHAPQAISDKKKNEADLLSKDEENKKTPVEKKQIDQKAAQKADEKQAAKKQAEQRAQKPDPKPAAIPKPPTNDLWISIPALGLYNNYVTNTNDGREGHAGPETPLDYGLIHLAPTGFPWQPNANTYIVGHRLGWPGTGSYHIFYNLPLLALGDVIYLGDVNGTTYTYRVSGFKEVSANDTSITAPQSGRNMVSLQTCIENYGDYWTMGPDWYVRYIVQADRVSVTPAK